MAVHALIKTLPLRSSQPINGGTPQKTSSDPWDFDMLSPAVSPKPTEQAKAPIARTVSPFDMFDDLEAATSSTSKLSLNVQSRPIAGTVTDNDANDDILGLLGKPVNTATPTPAVPVLAPRPAQKSPGGSSPTSSIASRPPSRPTAARTPSPPPHILGEVVSMGFSVQQARLALAATLGAEQPGKWSINAAMEILASDGAAHAARDRENAASPRRPFDNESGEDEDVYLHRQARKQKQKQVETPSGCRDTGRDGAHSSSESTAEMTANDLLQQASVFGSSMLKSANSYWKTSRAQLQKAIEEKKLAIPSVSGPSSGRSSPANAKPRWMTADTDFSEEAPKREGNNGKLQAGQGFRDFDKEDQNRFQNALPSHPSERPGCRSEQKRPEKVSIPVLSIEKAHDRRQTALSNGALSPHSASLLDVTRNEKRAYASPNRRKTASSSSSSAPVSSIPSQARETGQAQPQARPKPSRPPRPCIEASSAQLENSRKRRTSGNEHFKLGRYGDASVEYTSALNALPEGHIARVAALNNRANARLKNGEERQAAEDATAVLKILSAPTELQNVTRETWDGILNDFKSHPTDKEVGEKFDANDSLGKALSRRARGYEGCEKWRLAMLDWQMINELGDAAVVKSAGGMRVVSEGLSRCRKVVEGPAAKPTNAGPAKRAPPPRAAKPATSPRPMQSDAVDKFRETNKKAEADEAERLVVKDAVDAKMSEWRAGKENNLRALIASLDNVLWEELGWKKVGMHELITDSQLKIKYVRAISKVHPDKVSPSQAGDCAR